MWDVGRAKYTTRVKLTANVGPSFAPLEKLKVVWLRRASVGRAKYTIRAKLTKRAGRTDCCALNVRDTRTQSHKSHDTGVR